MQRWPFTAGFIGSMAATIYVSMVLHSYILSVIFAVIQVCFLTITWRFYPYAAVFSWWKYFQSCFCWKCNFISDGLTLIGNDSDLNVSVLSIGICDPGAGIIILLAIVLSRRDCWNAIPDFDDRLILHEVLWQVHIFLKRQSFSENVRIFCSQPQCWVVPNHRPYASGFRM